MVGLPESHCPPPPRQPCPPASPLSSRVPSCCWRKRNWQTGSQLPYQLTRLLKAFASWCFALSFPSLPTPENAHTLDNVFEKRQMTVYAPPELSILLPENLHQPPKTSSFLCLFHCYPNGSCSRGTPPLGVDPPLSHVPPCSLSATSKPADLLKYLQPTKHPWLTTARSRARGPDA